MASDRPESFSLPAFPLCAAPSRAPLQAPVTEVNCLLYRLGTVHSVLSETTRAMELFAQSKTLDPSVRAMAEILLALSASAVKGTGHVFDELSSLRAVLIEALTLKEDAAGK